MLGAFGKALVALRFFKRNLEEALEKAPPAALLRSLQVHPPLSLRNNFARHL